MTEPRPVRSGERRPRDGFVLDFLDFVRLVTWLSSELVDDRKKLATRCGILVKVGIPADGGGGAV